MDNVLVLSPHTDDGELGAGGMIAKLVQKGANIFYVAFSSGTANHTECMQATKKLGIPRKNVFIYNFTTRLFPEVRQTILDRLIQLREELQPRLLLAPSQNDIHQDHQVIAQEAVRAFKHSSILGYELPWNNLEFKPTYFSRLSATNVEDKLVALQCYESQKGRTYTPEHFRALAKVRGIQCNHEYAEAFEIVRWID